MLLDPDNKIFHLCAREMALSEGEDGYVRMIRSGLEKGLERVSGDKTFRQREI